MPTLRVMTYNVLHGGVGREQQIRDVVRAIGPHIAIFTEATSARSFDAVADMVGPHRARGGGTAARTCSLIASRWPILHWNSYGPPWALRKWIEATTQPFGGPPVTIHGIHLVPQLLWPFELWRFLEVGALLRRLAGAGEHLVAGDFNALSNGDHHRLSHAASWVRAQWLLQVGLTPRWAMTRLTDAGYIDCYRACHPDLHGFTVPACDPQVRVDYLFAPRSLAHRVRSSGGLEPTMEASAHPETPHRSSAEFMGWTAVNSQRGVRPPAGMGRS